MALLIQVLQALLPIAYGVIAWGFGSVFFGKAPVRFGLRRTYPFALLLLGAHALYIGLWTLQHGRCLLATFPELCSLLAFTLLSLYIAIEARLQSEAAATGFFVTLVAFVFQIVSSLLVDGSSRLPEPALLHEPIFNLHVTSALFGYAALMLATVYGGMYLLLHRAMERNQYGPVFEHLPNLERLERFGLRATAFGFGFLTIAIVLGWILANRTVDVSVIHFVFDPKTLTTLLIWLIFGFTLFMHRVMKLRGVKLVTLWLSGFVLTIISLSLVNIFATSFHRFL